MAKGIGLITAFDEPVIMTGNTKGHREDIEVKGDLNTDIPCTVLVKIGSERTDLADILADLS